MCLPKSFGDGGEIAIPRAATRAELASLGLTGKIHLESWMNEQEVMAEIRSVFQGPMHGDPAFPFGILQCPGAGSRSLTVPSVSSSFQWTAKQVVQAAGQGYIYIIAHKDLRSPDSHRLQGLPKVLIIFSCKPVHWRDSCKYESIRTVMAPTCFSSKG